MMTPWLRFAIVYETKDFMFRELRVILSDFTLLICGVSNGYSSGAVNGIFTE